MVQTLLMYSQIVFEMGEVDFFLDSQAQTYETLPSRRTRWLYLNSTKSQLVGLYRGAPSLDRSSGAAVGAYERRDEQKVCVVSQAHPQHPKRSFRPRRYARSKEELAPAAPYRD